MYLGACKALADRVRELLDRLQWRPRARRARRGLRKLQAQVRASLRQEKARLRKLLAVWGITLKGWEFRGVRRAFQSPPPHFLATAATGSRIPPHG